MPYANLSILSPFLDEALEAFYQQMLSSERLSFYFEDQSHISHLIEMQKQNYQDSLTEDEEAFKTRFIGLGKRHFAMKIPHTDFIRGMSFLYESLLHSISSNGFDSALYPQLLTYTKESNRWLSYGYLQCLIEQDENDLEKILGCLMESRLEGLDELIVEQMNWLKKIFDALRSENFTTVPQLDLEGGRYHRLLEGAFENDLFKQFEFLDKAHMQELHERLHLDADSIFYFLEQKEYTEVVALYNSLFNAYKMGLMFVSSMRAKFSIRELRDDLEHKEQSERQLQEIVAERTQQIQDISERYEVAIHSNNLGMWNLDVISGELEHNDSWFSVMGQEKENFGATLDAWKYIIYSEDMEGVLSQFRAILTGESQQYDHTYRVLTQKGDIRWVHDFGKPYHDQDGNLKYIIGFVQDVTEKKSAEVELRQTKKLLKAVIDSTGDMIYFKDMDLKYLGCNDAFASFVGQEKERIIGKSDFDLVNPDLANLFYHQDQEILRDNTSRTDYGWMELPDGKEAYLFTRRYLLKDDTGKVIGLVGTATDMSAQKRLEMEQERMLGELQRAYDEFEYLIDNISDIYVRMDQEGKITKISPACQRMFGYTPEEMLGRFLTDFYRDQNEKNTLLDSIKKNGREGVLADAYMVHKSAHEIWVSANFITLQDEEGNLQGIEGIARDLTHQRRYEERLQELNNELEIRVEDELQRRMKGEVIFQQITESTFDGIIMVNELGKIMTWSRACERIFGYCNAEIIGKVFEEMLLPDSLREKFTEGFAHYVCTGEGPMMGNLMEVDMLHKEGRVIPVEVAISRLSVDGEWYALGIIRDLSERKRLQEEKEHQERLLIQQSKMAEMGNMIAAIAHQWKQPLSSMALLTNLIEDDVSAYPEIESQAEKNTRQMMEHIEFLSHTIDDFRNFFKPSISKRTFFVKKSVEQMCNMLSSQFFKSGVKLDITGDSRVQAYGFDNEFKQVIMNITTNACDAIKSRGVKKGKIDISISERNEKETEIIITDNGGGIPEELLPDKLFDAYVSTKGDKGTGIGLSMSKSIIVQHLNGMISVSNTPTGARFEIILPSHESLGEEMIQKHLLYVEDEELVRLSATSILQSRYTQVSSAEDGEKGLELFSRNPEFFDLVITDINMPNMNGNEMARKILEIRPDIPILVITSLQEDVDGSIHFAYVTEKPFSRQRLFKIIDSILLL